MSIETPRAAAAFPSLGLAATRGQTPGTGEGKSPVPGNGAVLVLDATQLDLMLDALDDATEYWNADADCARCGAVLCDDCKAAAQKFIRYANFGRWARKAAGRG